MSSPLVLTLGGLSDIGFGSDRCGAGCGVGCGGGEVKSIDGGDVRSIVTSSSSGDVCGCGAECGRRDGVGFSSVGLSGVGLGSVGFSVGVFSEDDPVIWRTTFFATRRAISGVDGVRDFSTKEPITPNGEISD